MNLNELAKEIARLEGGKRNLNIADIKEVLKCLSIILFSIYRDERASSTGAVFALLIKNGKKWAGKK